VTDRRSPACGWPIAAVAGALVACGGPSSEEITLRVMNWAADLEIETEQEIADEFAADHRDVRVIVESVVGNYGEKLATAIASGTPPDVFLLDTPDIPAFVDRGLVLDLTPYAGRVGYDTRAIFDEVLGAFSQGERLFAFPKGFSPMVVYYNRLLFRQRGVPPPPDSTWTFEEFLATARAISGDDDGDGRIDVYAVNYPRLLYEWIPWVWSGGGDILDPSGSRTVGYLDSPATVETFRFLTDLVVRHEVTPPVQFLRTGDPMRVGRFFMGTQAMLVSGHWHMPRLLAYAERGDIEIGVAPIPHRAGVEPQTVLYAAGWAVPANVRHKRLAVELAAYLAGESAQRRRAAYGLEIPALRVVAEELAREDPLGVEEAFLRQVPYGRPSWGATVRDFYEIEELSVDIMDRRILRGDSLDVAAAQVARRIDEAIAR
jgi:multiple sugar transport system substrate-binding protein